MGALAGGPLLYLCVAHTGRSDEGLLDRVALGEGGLLLALWRLLLLLLLLSWGPVTLDEELHHLHVTPEGRVNQGALAVLVQVIHLVTAAWSVRQSEH